MGKVKSNVAWCVGRGHAKTAYLSNGYLCHQLVYRHKKYIVLVSETTGVAGDFIGWTRNQLKHNRKLREDFGELLSAQKTKNIAESKLLLVDFPAIQPYLSQSTSERLQITHLDHGSTEVSSKIIWVAPVVLYQLITFTTITLVELLIRM